MSPNRVALKEARHSPQERRARAIVRAGIALLVSLLGLPAPASPQNRVLEDYSKKVKSLVETQKEDLFKDCRAGDLSSIYFSSYELDGLLAAAEATGREDFLQVTLECVEAIIAAGKDQNGDGYIDFYHSADNAWDSTRKGISPSTLFKGLRPIPRAARVIVTRFRRKPYLAKAQELLAFTEKHIIEKWEKQGYLQEYRSGTIHIQGNFGEMLVDAYLATGNENYRKHAENYAKACKDNLILVDGGYAWNQVLGDKTLNPAPPDSLDGAHVSDTSHANETLAFATLACRAGIVFTEEDMVRFSTTFTKKLWRGAARPLADFVDGADLQGKGGPGKYGTFLSAGWAKLGLFSPDVEAKLSSREDGGHPLQYWGNLALNATLGGDKKRWMLAPIRR